MAGHFFAVKSTLAKQAEIQLQTQAYLSETLLDKTFNNVELLSDDIINSSLRSITQTQASISVSLVLADGSKTYTQQSSQPFHQPEWFTMLAQFDAFETSRTCIKISLLLPHCALPYCPHLGSSSFGSKLRSLFILH
ncbi:hypothetical protein JCM19237_1148 [Photobacterium aphoticum]|uniref:Uncharacterized protein n=1 Tax=Photobacterium aphoticum TaxID=754436 RepID=A0A090QNL1_9GAMM|nr:hypothetical protein JCM19237_1148 [Photobacterium aphoticum]